jgi:hypothetical protein
MTNLRTAVATWLGGSVAVAAWLGGTGDIEHLVLGRCNDAFTMASNGASSFFFFFFFFTFFAVEGDWKMLEVVGGDIR